MTPAIISKINQLEEKILLITYLAEQLKAENDALYDEIERLQTENDTLRKSGGELSN
jgi:regulator of replication initiation timing